MTPSQQSRCAPVAVFAYNRRDRLAAMLQSLQRCAGFAGTSVTIFVDGPRSEADRVAVDEVRTFVTNLSLPNVDHVISDENKGLRKSIYGGVSRIVEEHGRVIVLEDDLVLSPTALTYFNEALDFYADDPKVWSVSGYIYDVPELRNFPRALVLPSASSWGWATWSRAWSQFDLDARPRDENLNSESFRQAYNMNGVYPFDLVLRLSALGQVDSWAAHWLYTIFRNGGCSIFPPRRVVDNLGFTRGTHGSRFNPYEALVKRPPLLEQVPAFERVDEIDYFAADLMKRSWEARVLRGTARAGAFKRRLRR